MERWTEKEQTEAEVRMFILDQLCTLLPDPPYSPEDTESVANVIYEYVWERSASGYTPSPRLRSSALSNLNFRVVAPNHPHTKLVQANSDRARRAR